MMVDRKKRDAYAEVLRHFAAGLTTNLEYEKELDSILPSCKDQAVIRIFKVVWYTYDDIRKHKMRGDWALTPEGRRVVARCIMFLHTDCEYEYPLPRIKWGALLNLLTLGIWSWLRSQEPSSNQEPKGDHDVWPFFRRSDFEEAQKNPKLLAGTR